MRTLAKKHIRYSADLSMFNCFSTDLFNDLIYIDTGTKFTTGQSLNYTTLTRSHTMQTTLIYDSLVTVLTVFPAILQVMEFVFH